MKDRGITLNFNVNLKTIAFYAINNNVNPTASNKKADKGSINLSTGSTKLLSNRYNDHQCLFFGKKAIKQAPACILTLQHAMDKSKLRPSELIKHTLQADKKIGKGGNNYVYEIPIKGFENFLLRKPKFYKAEISSADNFLYATNPFKPLNNVSRAIATLGEYEIINRIEGECLSKPIEIIKLNKTLFSKMCNAYHELDDFIFY